MTLTVLSISRCQFEDIPSSDRLWRLKPRSNLNSYSKLALDTVCERYLKGLYCRIVLHSIPSNSSSFYRSFSVIFFIFYKKCTQWDIMSIAGDVVLPAGWDYRNGAIMKNYRFQSKLGAVVYPESTSMEVATIFLTVHMYTQPCLILSPLIQPVQ